MWIAQGNGFGIWLFFPQQAGDFLVFPFIFWATQQLSFKTPDALFPKAKRNLREKKEKGKYLRNYRKITLATSSSQKFDKKALREKIRIKNGKELGKVTT